MLGFRKAPFTCAHFPGKVNLVFLGVLYVFGFTMYSRTMASLEHGSRQSVAAELVFFTAAAAILTALRTLAQSLPRRHEAALDYEDAAEPIGPHAGP